MMIRGNECSVLDKEKQCDLGNWTFVDTTICLDVNDSHNFILSQISVDDASQWPFGWNEQHLQLAGCERDGAISRICG